MKGHLGFGRVKLSSHTAILTGILVNYGSEFSGSNQLKRFYSAISKWHENIIFYKKLYEK
jgi:hypothetical protein